MTSYIKRCIWCKETIEISDKDGKYVPYNRKGEPHNCACDKRRNR